MTLVTWQLVVDMTFLVPPVVVGAVGLAVAGAGLLTLLFRVRFHAWISRERRGLFGRSSDALAGRIGPNALIAPGVAMIALGVVAFVASVVGALS